MNKCVNMRHIGERFFDEHDLLEVIETDWGCKGCFYERMTCENKLLIRGRCSKLRADRTSVIFKKVES